MCTVLLPPGVNPIEVDKYINKQHVFREKKKFLNTKCVFSFLLQLLSETYLMLRRLSEI